MTAREFCAWQATMGWTNTEAARQLQRTRYTIQIYRMKGAPLYIGLAAAALAVGLAAWTIKAKKK